MARDEATEDTIATIYLEARVIDPNGHPVAGATLDIGDKNYGVTDSFGEWRRYVKTQPGSTLTLRASTRRNNKAKQSAAKQVTVPMHLPLEGEGDVAIVM